MKPAVDNPLLIWVVLDGSNPPKISRESFPGTPEDATATLQSRANRNEVSFGQVLLPDGKVFSNIAPGV
jgi:hypothetical protein